MTENRELTLAERSELQLKEAFESVCKAKREKKIIPAMVRVASLGNDTLGEHLIADYKGIKIMIPKDEVDDQIRFKNLMSFVGREIFVLIKTVNPSARTAIGSRADAQKILRPVIMNGLEEKKRSYVATVINTTMKYGVFVDIKGITGLLLNRDFADDVTRACEVLKPGDKISVHLKSVSDKKTLHFEADTKYSSPNALHPDEIAVNQIVLGIVARIVNTHTGPAYFVNVAKGVDALASSETSDSISTDDKVQMKVLKVSTANDGTLRVRGVIKGVL